MSQDHVSGKVAPQELYDNHLMDIVMYYILHYAKQVWIQNNEITLFTVSISLRQCHLPHP